VQNSHGKAIPVTVLRDKREQTVMMTAGAKKHSELMIAPPSWVRSGFAVHLVLPSNDWI
jgi:hypothetical protein